MKPTTGEGRLSLVVGVTGHMDICTDPRHEEALRVSVGQALTELRGDSNVPIVILTALAFGADRLVADVGLEMGCELVAVLPMPKADYEQDFLRLGQGQSSVDDFNRLLGRARNSFVARPAGVEREGLYAGVAVEIARSSHILLAVWDGGKQEKLGGTSWLVHRFLGLLRPDAAPGTWPHGPVFHVNTHREESRGPQEDCRNTAGFDRKWLAPREPEVGEESIRDFTKHVCSRIDVYNRDAARTFSRPLGLQNHYEVTDALAIRYNLRTAIVFGLVYIFAGFSAISFAKFAHTEHHPGLFVSIYAICLAVSAVSYLIGKQWDFQKKAEDYRALAEGLRVACAWRLLGIPESVSEHYLLRLPDEARWIRNALAAFERTADRGWESLSQPGTPGALRKTMEFWIRDELTYYVRAGERIRTLTSRLHLAAKGGLLFSLLFASPLVFAGVRSGETFLKILNLDRVLILSTACAIIAALTHNFIEKRALREHLHRYGRMAKLFRETQHWLSLFAMTDNGENATVSIAEATRALRAIAQEELDENGEWLQTHRERPLEILHGG